MCGLATRAYGISNEVSYGPTLFWSLCHSWWSMMGLMVSSGTISRSGELLLKTGCPEENTWAVHSNRFQNLLLLFQCKNVCNLFLEIFHLMRINWTCRRSLILIEEGAVLTSHGEFLWLNSDLISFLLRIFTGWCASGTGVPPKHTHAVSVGKKLCPFSKELCRFADWAPDCS